MKKKLFFVMCFLLIIGFAECNKDDNSNNINHKESCLSGDASLYKEITGEWKLAKAIPKGNTGLLPIMLIIHMDTSEKTI